MFRFVVNYSLNIHEGMAKMCQHFCITSMWKGEGFVRRFIHCIYPKGGLIISDLRLVLRPQTYRFTP